MASSVSMALAVIVFQTAAGTLNVSDLTRVYARETTADAALDVESTPRLAVDLVRPITELHVEYAPRFLWADVLGADPPPAALLHGAALRLSWSQPRHRVWFGQTAAIGDQNFARIDTDGMPADAAAPAPNGGAMTSPELDLLPPAMLVTIAAAETSAGLRYDGSRRWRSSFEVSFAIAGGADARAQALLPQQRTVQADTALDHRVTRRDDASAALSASWISTSNGYDHRLVSLIPSWTRRFTAQTGGELGAGVAFQDSRGPAETSSTEWVPAGAASLWHALLWRDAQLRLQWDLFYRPEINVLSGTLQRRLSTTAQARLSFARSSARLALGAAQSFPTDAPDAAELLSADLSLEHALLDWLALQFGAQLLRQRFTAPLAPSVAGARWLLYAGLNARLPEARF